MSDVFEAGESIFDIHYADGDLDTLLGEDTDRDRVVLDVAVPVIKDPKRQ